MKNLLSGLTAVFIFAIFNSAEAQDTTFLTNGLTVYYAFDGNTIDGSGNGNTGTPFGVALSNDRFNRANSAYTFTGNNVPASYIRITNATAVQFAGNFTFTAWVKFVGGTQGPRIVSTAGYEMTTEGTGAQRRLSVNNTTTTGVFGLDSTNAYPANTWLQVAYTKAGNQLAIYVNGRPEGTRTVTGVNNYSNGYVPKLGGNSGIEFDAFGGSMDDVRFYNRALSPNEIGELYRIEFGPQVNLIKAVKPILSSLTLGGNYQLQLSGSLNTWTNHGAAFTATNTTMIYPNYWDVENWNSLYFRLQTLP